MKKRYLQSIICAFMLVVLALSSSVAFAATTCVPDKEHLSAPTTGFAYSAYGSDRKAVYTVSWKSAYAYARCIFNKLPTDTSLDNDSGRVWKWDKPQATAYGKGNANGYWGHDCNASK